MLRICVAPAISLLCVLLCVQARGGGDSSPPNIVLIVADDLGYGELGCQGNRQIPTPHIDSIAACGVRFTDGYVTAPFCSASRAGLMTGRYQTRFGYEFNPVGVMNEDPAAGLPLSEVTLARHLHDVGYTTALVGKWHLGGTAKHHPLRRGFDEFFGFLHEGHYFVPPPYHGVTTMLRRRSLPGGGSGRWISDEQTLVYSTHMGHDEPAYDADNPLLRSGQPFDEREYLTDAFTREAIAFIERNTDKPFFLYLAYNAVHSPLQAPEKHMRRLAHVEDIHRRIFAAMLASLDEGVGRVLQAVRDARLDTKTLIVFISDNGGPTRELTSSNKPLKGGKGDVYEGGLRVPFLMQWTGQLPAGTVYRHPVLSLDVYATSAAVAGAPIPERRRIDGANLLPYLHGHSPGRPHAELFWRIGRRAAVRVGDWKLLRNATHRNGANWELYNLADDISEDSNLATEHPERVTELKDVWLRYERQMMAPAWTPGR